MNWFDVSCCGVFVNYAYVFSVLIMSSEMIILLINVIS